jgi:phosphatidylinositol phospholipase C delta
LNEAQLDLASSYEREKNLEADAKRAASDARASREHADTARQRVETVRDMLRNWKNSATSAESVVHTAMTEAKISDQRASETEARAKFAAANADKDRARAELETQKEERFEHEAAELHEQSVEATNQVRLARDKLNTATSRLEKLNERIKLIEKSTQYQKEISEGGDSKSNDDSMSERTPRHVSKFVAKRAAKLQEKEECQKAITKAVDEHDDAEKKRRMTQDAFEEKARMWKRQADVASKARKQADRTMTIVEELEEHAEEEREAAKLRKVAHEKAASNVQQSDSYRSSVQAQLIEAERASAEAASKAAENRSRAERLAKEAAGAKDHSVAIATLESRKLQHQEVLRLYEVATEEKRQAEAKVADAKRVLERSSDLVKSGKRSAAVEVERMNAEKHAERNAILAYNKAVLSQKQAAHAMSLVKLAETTLNERKAALSHARDYKEKMGKVARISLALATMTLLDSQKFKYWEKSHTLQCTQMHSFSQRHFVSILDVSAQVNDLLKFSRNHIVRTFPSLKVTEHVSHVNYNPVSQWAVGCQLVSMNFQSADEHLLANDGRFRMNGSSGYVLKPRYLLQDNQPAEKPQHWKFEILNGRCLPKPESAGRRGLPVGLSPSSQVNPFVRVSLYDGVTGKDPLKVIFTSKVAERNGLNPVWDTGQDFEVSVERPSIAVLLFTVWDKRGDSSLDFIAGSAMPVSCLREGYRTVSLFDSLHTKCGPYSFASLLARAHKLS